VVGTVDAPYTDADAIQLPVLMQSNLLVRVWALVGITILFGEAIVRLGMRAVRTIQAGLTTHEWAMLVAVTAMFLYFEGWRGIQGRYAPFVVERLTRLRTERGLGMRLLAPLYAMALVGATRRQLTRAWLGVAAVVAAILIVRALPDPWRGIIDFGVSAALLWGLAAIIILSLQERAA
jgi:hypothetical protein